MDNQARDTLVVIEGRKYYEIPDDKSNRQKSSTGKVFKMPKVSKTYTTKGEGFIKIGSGKDSHVVVNTDSEIVIKDDKLLLLRGNCYINGILNEQGEYSIEPGDCLLVATTKIVLKEDCVECFGFEYQANLKVKIQPQNTIDMDDFPEYKRSPRVVKQVTNKQVDIVPPPEKELVKKGQLLKTILPPLIMVVLTIATSILLGRGLYMIVMAAGMMVTTVFSVTTYFSDKKEREEKEKKRIEKYSEYLLTQRKKLYDIRSKEEDARQYNAPTLDAIELLINDYSSRIYERTANDDDFLCVSLGKSKIQPDYKISFRKDELSTKSDEMLDEAETVVNEFKTIEDMPQVIDLKKAHLGIVGEKKYIHEQLQGIISQLCFFQSYHDIEIVTITDEEHFSEFRWSRWYPHSKIKNINVSGIIYGENQRDQVLGNITQVLKERKMKMEEDKKENIYLPHYVFIIENPKLIINHSIMEYLQNSDSQLGFSIIYTTNMKANLPENIKTIMSVDGKGRGTLMMEEGTLRNAQIKTPSVNDINLEKMARRLSPLKHNTGVSTQIPEAITYFGLFGVKRPEDLPIEELWSKSNSAKSLAVPLGLRGKDDVVELNLHEKAHGPHGLVAGTTGSGKSEILQSYILSLAMHFHPHEVGFLLIDYKGGGMANLFKNLPHLLGTITNLDGSESMRALASIKSELARRQRIFNDNDVNNINQYTKLFKKGEATIPLPHLFLISDEFAELKKEQPDFMSELVSAARIGRSLGVHLILATQKPSGVVDDQIWSNSKFKLALKVQDESDSKEVLKTPDAASITIPGRAYLQVGNNEIYELFQSAWSGADYSEDEVEKGFDNRVYKINDLGQGELLNEDLSGGEVKKDSKLSQLDVVVNQIKKVYDTLGSVEVEKPWLPSLDKNLVNKSMEEIYPMTETGYDLDCAVGMSDLPEAQRQEEYIHNFMNDGNFAVFGASGFGKSTTIMNMVLNLAAKNSAKNLNYYIMDFGNSSLVQLKDLTHTADYFTYDQEEKLEKMMSILMAELSKRKQLFAKESAINFKMYNQVASEKLPAIVVVVDNYDVVREMEIELAAFFIKLTRDGPGIGIYTIISASSDSMVRYAVLNNFKNKITHFMFDPMDVRAIVGRSNYELPEVKGRAMVKLEEVSIMQCYLPVQYEDDVQYSKNIGEIVTTISNNNTNVNIKGIPMLPDIVNIKDITVENSEDDHKIPIGLDSEEVMKQSMNLREDRHLIIGGAKTGKTNLLKLISAQMANKQKFIVDASGDIEDFVGEDMTVYLRGSDDAEEFNESLKSVVDDREELYEEDGNGMRPKEFYSTLDPVCLIIDNGENMIDICKEVESEIGETLKRFINTGGTIITAAQPRFRGRDSITSILSEATSGVVLGNPKDQTDFDFAVDRNTKAVKDIGYLCGDSDAIKIKIPLV